MTVVRLLVVPYDSGHRGERQGLGPANLIEHWRASPEEGSLPEAVWVESASDFPTEVATTFELMGRVADQVRSALDDNRFPLVVAGNCTTSAVGGAAGLRQWDPAGEVGVVWFDTHGDFNTPETDPLGFLDGQGLAILTGRCWQGMTRQVPGFEPVSDRSVMLVGAHDLDPSERVALARSQIAHITPSRIRSEGVELAVGAAVEALATRVTHVYFTSIWMSSTPTTRGPTRMLLPVGSSLINSSRRRVVSLTASRSLPLGSPRTIRRLTITGCCGASPPSCSTSCPRRPKARDRSEAGVSGEWLSLAPDHPASRRRTRAQSPAGS